MRKQLKVSEQLGIYKISSKNMLTAEQMEEFEKRIEINSKILLGKPIIHGTRIPVELVIKLVAQGWKEKEIIKEYPSISKEDIQAALLYAEKVIEGEEIYPLVNV